MPVALAIYRHELRRLFLTPVAPLFLAVCTLLGGLFFLLGLQQNGEASVRTAMMSLGVVWVFCVPMITMRQLADEARSGTLEWLLTAPLPLWALIGGKWAATSTLLVAVLAATAPWILALSAIGDPDLGVLVTTYLGMALCGSSFVAVGLLASSLTRDPIVAGVVGVGLLLPFWLTSVALDQLPLRLRPWLVHMSFVDHLQGFARGVLDTSDLTWFLVLTVLPLSAAWRVLESRRWR